jgi:hypothetical protein
MSSYSRALYNQTEIEKSTRAAGYYSPNVFGLNLSKARKSGKVIHVLSGDWARRWSAQMRLTWLGLQAVRRLFLWIV